MKRYESYANRIIPILVEHKLLGFEEQYSLRAYLEAGDGNA